MRLRVFVNALSEFHFRISAIVYRYSRIFLTSLVEIARIRETPG